MLFSFPCYSCLPIEKTTNDPPLFVKGKWVQSKPQVQPNRASYFKQLLKLPIVFSATVELTYTDNQEIGKSLYVHEIWKGHLPKVIELNGFNSSIRVDDFACGQRLVEGEKYVFAGVTGRRSSPVRITRVYNYGEEIRKTLKSPIKIWIKNHLIEKNINQ